MKKLISIVLFLFICSSFLLLHAQQYVTEMGSDGLPMIIRKKSDNLKVDEPVVYKDWRFTVGGGYAHRLGKSMDYGSYEANRMMDDLKNGFNLDLEWQYFFKEHWGLGLNAYFDRHKTSGVLEGINVDSHTNFIYIGPTFNMRFELDPKFTLYMGMGFGPLFYSEETKGAGLTVNYDKTVFASYVSISGDYYFNQGMGMGLKLSVGGGTAKGQEFGTDDRVSFSNLMVTAYLSFRSK